MANEFVAKNGLISQNNTIVSGSLTVTQGITGSLQGTASWSTNALTASLAPNYVLTSTTSSMLVPYLLSSQTSSFITNSQTSSMTVATASFANAVDVSYVQRLIAIGI
jgi:hypothetical protein